MSNIVPLIIGGGILAYFMTKKSNNTAPSNTSGFIYTCNNIKILNKEKMMWYLFNLTKNQIDSEYENFTDVLNGAEFTKKPLNIKDIFLKVFKKINNTCYDKLMEGKTTGVERIIIGEIFLDGISGSIEKYLIQLKYGIIYKYNENSEQKLGEKNPIGLENWIKFREKEIQPQLDSLAQWLEPMTEEDEIEFKKLTGLDP